MSDKPDRIQLREFAETRSEQTFAALVLRHVDLVFGTALRRVQDRTAAEEITQDVFILLARKAAWLPCQHSLAGWLHRTTLLEARQWWRGELRRQRREEAAAELHTTMKVEESALESLVPLLDDALLHLGEKDRQAVILRYFEERSHRDVGVELGISEEAARKRIDKALGRITFYFQKRGYALSGTAGAVSVLMASAHGAPTGLVSATVKAALATSGTVAPGLLALLAARYFRWTRFGTTAACLLISAGPIVWQTQSLLAARSERSQLLNRLTQVQSEIGRQQQEQTDLEKRLAIVGRSFEDLKTEMAHRQAFAKSIPPGSNPDLYRWVENSEYVRLPKELLTQVRLYDPPMDPRPDSDGQIRWSEVLNRRGQVSEVLLRAMGLDDEAMGKVKAAFVKFAGDFRDLEAEHATLSMTRGGNLDQGEVPKLVIEPFVEEGGTLQRELRQKLDEAMGPERAAILWHQCSGTFDMDFGNCGARHRTRVLHLRASDPMPMIEESEEGQLIHGVAEENLPDQFRPYVVAWREQQQQTNKGLNS